VCIKQLLDQFEAKTYRDDDEGAREKIVELMGEVRPLSFPSTVPLRSTQLQTHGSPPDDMIGPLPPGISMGADGLPDMEGCNLN
jgi:peroxin-19